MRALLVFAHGSSVPAANAAVHQFAALLEGREFGWVRTCFLELAHPDLPEAVRDAVSSGYSDITVVPYFLTPGVHTRQDLPRIVADLRGIYPDVKLFIGDALNGHPALVDAILDRARSAQRQGDGV